MSELTPKQEKFCLRYIETGDASVAYRLSYDAENMKPITINRKAKELLDNGKIAARLRTLREMHVNRHIVTVDTLTAELDEDRRLARDLKQPAAAITAVMGKAKLHGFLVDKSEVKAEVEVADVSAAKSKLLGGIVPLATARGADQEG